MKYLFTALTILLFSSCSTEHLNTNEAVVTFEVTNQRIMPTNEGFASVVIINKIHKSNIDFKYKEILLYRDVYFENGSVHKATISENKNKFTLNRVW